METQNSAFFASNGRLHGESDTPRTDAALDVNGSAQAVLDSVTAAARDLERMLAAKESLVASLEANNAAVARVLARSEADAKRLRSALELVAGCVADADGGTTLGSYEMGVVRAALTP